MSSGGSRRSPIVLVREADAERHLRDADEHRHLHLHRVQVVQLVLRQIPDWVHAEEVGADVALVGVLGRNLQEDLLLRRVLVVNPVTQVGDAKRAQVFSVADGERKNASLPWVRLFPRPASSHFFTHPSRSCLVFYLRFLSSPASLSFRHFRPLPFVLPPLLYISTLFHLLHCILLLPKFLHLYFFPYLFLSFSLSMSFSLSLSSLSHAPKISLKRTSLPFYLPLLLIISHPTIF